MLPKILRDFRCFPREIRFIWLAAVFILLVAPSASAYTILFEDDFSDYDYFNNPFMTTVAQLPDAVQLEAVGGTGKGISPLISLPSPGETGMMRLKVLALDVNGQAYVQYFDTTNNYIETEVVLPSLLVGVNVGAFGISIPAGAEKMRLVLRLTDGNSGTYDHVVIRAVPEPEVFALMGLGLLLLAAAGRRV